LNLELFSTDPAHCRRRTPLGEFIILWVFHQGRPQIVRVLLAGPASPPEQAYKSALLTRAATCPEIEALADDMEAFLDGAAITFSLDSVLLYHCSPFQQQVLRAEHGIPRSQVSTYQLLAAFIGKPSAARAVGTALATNPFPIIIPCHRAIRSDRTLGGFQGGLPMKRALLEKEGIAFDSTGRVQVESFWYSSPLYSRLTIPNPAYRLSYSPCMR
jgi:methylated-DNA-[protein]-cysteine S-methyltransferase